MAPHPGLAVPPSPRPQSLPLGPTTSPIKVLGFLNSPISETLGRWGRIRSSVWFPCPRGLPYPSVRHRQKQVGGGMAWVAPCLLPPVLLVFLASGEMQEVKERAGTGSRVALWPGGWLCGPFSGCGHQKLVLLSFHTL